MWLVVVVCNCIILPKMILHISLFAKLNHNGWMNLKTCPMWFALFRIVSLDEWMESYVISVNSQVNTKALDSGNHGKYSTHIKYFSLLAAALFWSIWPHEICLCNQNHIKPMSVIWSLKLFSQKINIESMISHDIDFDSASKSSKELKNHIFYASLFLFNNFLLLLTPLIKCVKCEHIMMLSLP